MFNFIPIKSEEAVLGFVVLVLLSLLLYKHWKGQPAPAPPKRELEIKRSIKTVKQQLVAADQQREEQNKAPAAEPVANRSGENPVSPSGERKTNCSPCLA
jgi:hypothetical protein